MNTDHHVMEYMDWETASKGEKDWARKRDWMLLSLYVELISSVQISTDAYWDFRDNLLFLFLIHWVILGMFIFFSGPLSLHLCDENVTQMVLAIPIALHL